MQLISRPCGRRYGHRCHGECRGKDTSKSGDSSPRGHRATHASTAETWLQGSPPPSRRSPVRQDPATREGPVVGRSSRMCQAREPERRESRVSTPTFHECAPPHPEPVDVGQHRTQFFVDTHHVGELRILLLEDFASPKNRLLPLDAAISGKVEGFARQPGTCRPTSCKWALTQRCPGWVPFQVQIEPRILLGIEPRLGGHEHQRRVGRCHKLESDVGCKRGPKVPQRSKYRALPAWMKMALHLVEQHDYFAGWFRASQLRSDSVLTPGPGQHVRERDDSPYAGRRVNDRHLASVVGLDRWNVARIVDRQTQGPSRPEHMTGPRLRRQRPQDRSHAFSVVVVSVDPLGPVVQQPVAHGNRASIGSAVKPVPDLRLGEHVRRTLLVRSGLSWLSPVVPSVVPHRERSVCVRVDHKPPKCGIARFFQSPRLVGSRKRRFVFGVLDVTAETFPKAISNGRSSSPMWSG